MRVQRVRTTRRARLTTAAVSVALLAGLATGCGDTDKKDAKAAAPSASASQTPAADKPVQATPASFLEKAGKRGEQVKSFRMLGKGTVAGTAFEQTIDLHTEPMAMHMTMTGGTEGKVEIVLVDEAMYMGADGQYLKFDMKAMKDDPKFQDKLKGLGAKAGAAETQGTAGPGAQAGPLAGAKDLRIVGEETVDGVKTTRLSGKLSESDVLKAKEGESAADKANRDKLAAQIKQFGLSDLTMDVWIGEDGMTRQVKMVGRSEEGPVDVTMRFTDIDKAPAVKAPTGDKVLDLAAMMKEEGGGA
ncbi:LppX_LprAFG lipoprotein [Streptomyces sp. BI20]|uniref:LppX_LprAFG lipoprotein n=1 Tax=Streptomyces sp. BI20 TaxID=3403460 RepID=UPI003C74762E